MLAAAGTIAVTTLQSHLSERGVTRSVVEQQRAMTQRVAIEIDEKLLLAQASLSQLAAAVPSHFLDNPASLERYLGSQIGVRPLFRNVLVVDVKGNRIASVPPLDPSTRSLSITDRDWFRDSLSNGGTKTISKPLISRLTNNPVVLVTFPIHDEVGILQGLIVASLDLNDPHMLASVSQVSIGKSGYFILLSQDGSIVMHKDRNRLTRHFSTLGVTGDIARGLNDPTLPDIEGRAPNGQRALISFSKVSSANWTLVSVQSHQDALAALDRLWKQMLFAGIALSLLLIPMIWWLVSRMLQPLDALRRDIALLGQGVLTPERSYEFDEAAHEFQEVRNEFSAMAQARRIAEIALQREKEMMEVTLHSIGDAVIVTDAEGRITSMNGVAEQITGWSRSEAFERPFSTVFCILHEETGVGLDDVAKRAILEKTVVSLPVNTILRAKDGRDVPVDDSAAPILDDYGIVHGAVVVFRDVAIQRAAAREINWRATHDALTRLPNRSAFEAALETLMTSMEDDALHAVLMLDLDQFKIVNDTSGHAAGDELLKRLATSFQSHIRKSDLVARLGGDEFAVLMYHCPGEKAMRLAEELRRTVADMRFVWEDNVFRIGASIGVVAVDKSFVDAANVQKAADMACYMAKRNGRNRICVHSKDDRQLELMRHEMQAVSRIQQAIDENRLRIFAQRIVPVNTSNSKGEYFEVLVRLLDEHGNLIPPSAFLPAAERYGLMDDVDRWVIANAAKACADIFGPNEWRDLNTMCINLSAKTLQDKSIGPYILDQLVKYGVPFDRVCFEVTESAAIENIHVLRELIQSLRLKGLRFALDDFGVGMTSLAQLRDLPVDVLKIDGSFVTNVHRDRINAAMISSIQTLARLLSMKTVAERVEHPEELVHLQALGVDYAQGYLFSIPAPIEELFTATV